MSQAAAKKGDVPNLGERDCVAPSTVFFTPSILHHYDKIVPTKRICKTTDGEVSFDICIGCNQIIIPYFIHA